MININKKNLELQTIVMVIILLIINLSMDQPFTMSRGARMGAGSGGRRSKWETAAFEAVGGEGGIQIW